MPRASWLCRPDRERRPEDHSVAGELHDDRHGNRRAADRGSVPRAKDPGGPAIPFDAKFPSREHRNAAGSRAVCGRDYAKSRRKPLIGAIAADSAKQTQEKRVLSDDEGPVGRLNLEWGQAAKRASTSSFLRFMEAIRPKRAANDCYPAALAAPAVPAVPIDRRC